MTAVVVKLGGHALDGRPATSVALAHLAADISALRDAGTAVALVHGGGPQIGDLLDAVGIAPRFVDGLRVTDATTMRYVAMALGLVNAEIVAAFNAFGVPALGLSGVDGTLIRATPAGGEWGRVGKSPVIDVAPLRAAWEARYTPVISSIAVDDVGELLNCNADAVAGALSCALSASALVLLSDVSQVRANPDDPASVLGRIDRARVQELLDSGAARDGMRPKLRATLDALDGGATRVLLADGTPAHALSHALRGEVAYTEVVA